MTAPAVRALAPSLVLGATLALAVMVVPTASAASRRGIYAEANLGATGFLGAASDFAAVGPAAGLRAGVQLFPWLSVGGLLALSTHEAILPPPPDGEALQLYTAAADARLAFGGESLRVFAEGGLGLASISTNILDRVGVTAPDRRSSVAFHAGGGVDWHLKNRHFSIGAAGDWTTFPDFDATQAVTGRLYLRYVQ